jgi:hypothetical protein
MNLGHDFEDWKSKTRELPLARALFYIKNEGEKGKQQRSMWKRKIEQVVVIFKTTCSHSN